MAKLLITCLIISAAILSAEIQSLENNSVEPDCYQCHYACFTPENHGHPGTDNNGCACCHNWTGVTGESHNVSRPTNSDCTGCHRNSTDYRINAAHQAFPCTTCHSPHGSDFQHLLSKDSNILCTEQCHTVHKLGSSHPRGHGTTDCNTGGELTCTSSCHRIHTTCPEKLLSSPPPELCARCHPDKF